MAETKTNLDKWLYLVRRIEEHREEDAVKKLKKLYKGLIKDLRKSMGDVYADHADPETGALSYAELHRLGLDARLLEEVASRMNDVTQEEKRIITETVEQTYSNCYSGMVQAVEKAVDNGELRAAFSTVEAVKPEVLRAAVNNPVHGLTLSDQLEKNRADIIYSIKQAVGVGLSQGDRYDTMARRIQQTLIGPDGAGGSYYKAVRIARTEAHRVREEGNLDAAQNLTEQLEPAGITMVKTWHTMKDERVRPNRARKTKGGWKYSKGGKYDHVSMEGVQVGINEEFKLPSGAKTQAPGKSGVAGEDINCRCFLSYDVVNRRNNNGTRIGILDNRIAFASITSEANNYNPDAAFNIHVSGVSKEINEKINQCAKQVIDWGHKDGKEHGYTINILTGESIPYHSDEADSIFGKEFFDYLATQPAGSIITLHNHADSRGFSYQDINTFVTEKALKANIVAGHNGCAYLVEGCIQGFSTGSSWTDADLFTDIVDPLREDMKNGKITAAEFSTLKEERCCARMAQLYFGKYEVLNA